MTDKKKNPQAQEEPQTSQQGQKGGEAAAEDIGLLEEEEIEFFSIVPEDEPETPSR